MADRNGIDVGTGVIDSDFRGDISVLLFNFDRDSDFIRGSHNQISNRIR